MVSCQAPFGFPPLNITALPVLVGAPPIYEAVPNAPVYSPSKFWLNTCAGTVATKPPSTSAIAVNRYWDVISLLESLSVKLFGFLQGSLYALFLEYSHGIVN